MLKKFYHTITQKTLSLHWAAHLALAVISFGLYRGTNIILDASYARSKFPVPFTEGQTSFDGAQIKEWYGFMIEQGTLGIYWQTQIIDFTFIASVIVMGLLLPSFIARLHKDGSWLQRITMWCTVIMPLGAMFDAIENLFSFVMLARPETFSNWLAIPYSTFAVLKFAALGTSISWIMISLVLAGLLAAWRWIRQPKANSAGLGQIISG